MPSETGRFRRADRILRSREFRHVIERGERMASHSFVVFLQNGVRENAAKDRTANRTPDRTRLGITVSKRVGNSVVRNRVKRRIREWFRHSRPRLPSGAKLVVIARPPARGLQTRILFAELDRVFRLSAVGGTP